MCIFALGQKFFYERIHSIILKIKEGKCYFSYLVLLGIHLTCMNVIPALH